MRTIKNVRERPYFLEIESAYPFNNSHMTLLRGNNIWVIFEGIFGPDSQEPLLLCQLPRNTLDAWREFVKTKTLSTATIDEVN